MKRKTDGKIINIRSEILYRSAEDDFFYFNKINQAYKKLNKAVLLTPWHLKSLIMLADTAFIKGYIKKSLKLYLRAKNISPQNVKVLASIANCYFYLSDYSSALSFCNMVIEKINTQNYNLFLQIFEMKISILIALKQYRKAYITQKTARSLFDASLINSQSSINNTLPIKKLHQSNLSVV